MEFTNIRLCEQFLLLPGVAICVIFSALIVAVSWCLYESMLYCSRSWHRNKLRPSPAFLYVFACICAQKRLAGWARADNRKYQQNATNIDRLCNQTVYCMVNLYGPPEQHRRNDHLRLDLALHNRLINNKKCVIIWPQDRIVVVRFITVPLLRQVREWTTGNNRLQPTSVAVARFLSCVRIHSWMQKAIPVTYKRRIQWRYYADKQQSPALAVDIPARTLRSLSKNSDASICNS